MVIMLYLKQENNLWKRKSIVHDVDRFIIEEATMTFSGEPKELCFEKNKNLILSKEEIVDKFRRESKEEEQRMREDMIDEIMKTKNYNFINI